MRVFVLLLLVVGCVQSEHRFGVSLTYDGERTTASITFPSYTRLEGTTETVEVSGTVDGDAPIASARLRDAAGVLSYELHITRHADDYDHIYLYVEGHFDEADLGHAKPCLYTTKSCSVIMTEAQEP